ncbi:MAG: glycosyltransferase family 4 protein [Ignavibacteria bacterium]|nr:glycosyltransferase family 4 protein [Ignavibacteria bacterium]
MEKKIVFINQATGYLTIDIVNAFAKHFDRTALITGSIRVQDIPLNSKVEISGTVKYDRGNTRKKMTSWLIGTVQIFFHLLFKYRSYDVFYITIPPTAYLLSLILPNRFSVLVFDVYPDILKIYNIGENKWIYKSWTRWNKKLFKKAHRLYTIGEGMRKLLSQYVEKDKIKIIPNWSGLTKIKPVSKADNPFIIDNKVSNKFIVQYSGNIGYTHNVESLIKIAREMKDHDDILFLIIGRGDRVNHIKNLIEEYKLSNCMMLPFQPDEVLNYSLAAADIGVVLLDDKTAHASVPSKIYNLQAVGVPILAIASLDSEIKNHISEYGNGETFTQNDIEGIKNFILKCKSDKDYIKLISDNSLKASQDFTMKNADKYYSEYV